MSLKFSSKVKQPRLGCTAPAWRFPYYSASVQGKASGGCARQAESSQKASIGTVYNHLALMQSTSRTRSSAEGERELIDALEIFEVSCSKTIPRVLQSNLNHL